MSNFHNLDSRKMHPYYTIMHFIVLHFMWSCFIHTHRSHSLIQFCFSSNRVEPNSPINNGQQQQKRFLPVLSYQKQCHQEDLYNIYVKHGCPHSKYPPA